jgi:hypothetical protein
MTYIRQIESLLFWANASWYCKKVAFHCSNPRCCGQTRHKTGKYHIRPRSRLTGTWGRPMGFDSLDELREFLVKEVRFYHPKSWRKVVDNCLLNRIR